MPEEIRHIPIERGITKVALMRGDEELSRTLVVPMTMQVGRARLRMDGIGDVATPEEHRFKGYSRRVLDAAVSFMTAGDAVLTTLYGIPDFYPKYGYATLGPESVITVRSVEERAGIPGELEARAGEPGDLPALQRLYREETATSIGALVRDDDWWTWSMLEEALQPGANEVRVIVRDRVIVGYAWKTSTCWWMKQWTKRGPEQMKIGEAFATDAEAADAVLAACRLWSQEEGGKPVALAIPGTVRVGAAARLQNVNVTEQFHDAAEFMGRSIGLAPLLRAMRPELESRWRSMSGSMPPFAITIVAGNERATMRSNEQGVEIDSGRTGDVEVCIDPGNVARLALGGFDPVRILERLRIPVAVFPVLTTLFSRQFPYIYPVDRF